MQNSIEEILNGFFERINGLIAVMLVDIDGIPIESIGKFDIPPDDIGALISASFLSYKQIGEEFSQDLVNIMVEYNNLKLYQISMKRSILIILADKNAYLGMIRLEASRAIEKLTKIMEESELDRKELMNKHKFRAPSEDDIADILSKFGE